MSSSRILAAALALVAFYGCQSAPKTTPEQPGTGEPEAGPEEYAEIRPGPLRRDQLTVAFSQSELELDFRKSYFATDAQLYTALYEGLFSYHPYTGQPLLGVAEGYVLSSDKKVWTFTLREDARYWNGDQVTAGDFRAAWLSLLDPGRSSPYSSLFDIIEGARDYRLGRGSAERVGVSCPDNRTLVVRLTSPASFFPNMLCHHSFSPIHPSMLNDAAWASGRPVSNGPYYIEENDEDHLLFLKNENYWDAGNVTLERIVIAFTDAEEATALWNSGESRWIDGSFDFEALIDRSFQYYPLFATHYYFVRSAEKPWNDSRVRRALTLALPWEELRGAYTLPAETLIYPLSGYPEVEGLSTTDTAAAAALLAEAGYADGKGLPELVILTSADDDSLRVVDLMITAWQEIGVQGRVKVVDSYLYNQAMQQEEYTVGYITWIGDFADPYTFLQMWQRDSNLNDARYNDPEFEALMEKSMSQEGTERLETLAKAEGLLLSGGVVWPMYYSATIHIIDTDEIGGWYPNPLDVHPFKYLYYMMIKALPGVALAR